MKYRKSSLRHKNKNFIFRKHDASVEADANNWRDGSSDDEWMPPAPSAPKAKPKPKVIQP